MRLKFSLPGFRQMPVLRPRRLLRLGCFVAPMIPARAFGFYGSANKAGWGLFRLPLVGYLVHLLIDDGRVA